MFLPVPHPTFWDDPGPLPVLQYRRKWWKNFYPLQEAWVLQWKRHTERLAADEEKQRLYADQQAEYQIMMRQYQEQGEYWAEALPNWLHSMRLSYRRTVQERKDTRPYEKVTYCQIEEWFFDEYAYYFWIATWPLPTGLKITDFEPNNSQGAIAQTLSASFGTTVKVEFNDRYHARPGLWIVAEHRAGRGQIPNHVSYQKIFGMMPKGAKKLAWPVGQGVNSRILIADLGELYHLGIGGQTGGGKSNQINVMLGTFLSRNTPQELRLFLVDFKRVELAFYKKLPHLGGDVQWINKPTYADESDDEEEPILLRTVGPDYQPRDDETLHDPLGKTPVTQGAALLRLLDYILSEILRRMAVMEGRVKKISQWNTRFPKNKMSDWVLVIDELGDIMLQPGINKKVERKLVRILQLGRAAGIHAILATQTPKSEVITSLIQNNLTAWVVTRTGTGAASGLMLDGKHNAAKLPARPGRIIFRQAGEMYECQTPEITDMTIRQIVKSAKSGDLAAARPKYTIAPDKIFAWALDELTGYCSERDLFEHFKKEGVGRKEIREILRDCTVAGSPPALEPEIEIGEKFYYLSPYIKGSTTPRQLIPLEKFINEFDEKWADHVIKPEPDTVRRAPHAPEITPHPQGENGKIQEIDKILETQEAF